MWWDDWPTVDHHRQYAYPSGMSQSPFVVYCRVSTEEQGRSGLGLEAQLFACMQHVQRQGGTVLATFQDIASGGDDTRPQFALALAMCRRKRVPLLVAMLDRVARDVATTAVAMKGVRIVGADAPADSTFIQHIKAAMAEEEKRKISVRTVEALAAAKRRGVLLGSARPGHWDGREGKRLAGLEKARAKLAVVRAAAKAAT